MTVALTVSKTLGGAEITDSLDGGESGYNLGTTNGGEVSPTQNPLYIKHNGTAKITALSFYIGAYTGTYGGDYTAAADLTKTIAHGDAGFGIEIDMDYDAAVAFAAKTTIKSGVGISYATRILMAASAMIYKSGSSEVAPTSPVAGELGESTNSTLGDYAKLLKRYMLPITESLPGKRQYDMYFCYYYTT